MVSAFTTSMSRKQILLGKPTKRRPRMEVMTRIAQVIPITIIEMEIRDMEEACIKIKFEIKTMNGTTKKMLPRKKLMLNR